MLPFGYEPCTVQTQTLPCHNPKHRINTQGSLSMYLWWSSCALCLHTCQVRVTVGNSGLCCCFEDVPQVVFMYLVFTPMPGESDRRRCRSLLLCLWDVFQALINSLVWWFFPCHGICSGSESSFQQQIPQILNFCWPASLCLCSNCCADDDTGGCMLLFVFLSKGKVFLCVLMAHL